MFEKQILKYIAWIKSSDIRKKILKTATFIYCPGFIIYLMIFFRIQEYRVVLIELLCALIFYILIWVYALTFKK